MEQAKENFKTARMIIEGDAMVVIPPPESTLNEDQQMSCCVSMNNDLSLIDYSYLIANHGSDSHDQVMKGHINNHDVVHVDYVKMNPNLNKKRLIRGAVLCAGQI